MERKHLPVRIQSRGSCLPRIAAFLLTALLSCISTMTFAYDFSAVNEDGVTIYYNYINGNEAEVTYKDLMDYESYSGIVNIPATVTHDGTARNVTSIGDCAFFDCKNLTSVTLPNSVTSIENGAFVYCTGLTEVILQGDTPSNCHEYAFTNVNLSQTTLYCPPWGRGNLQQY